MLWFLGDFFPPPYEVIQGEGQGPETGNKPFLAQRNTTLTFIVAALKKKKIIKLYYLTFFIKKRSA